MNPPQLQTPPPVSVNPEEFGIAVVANAKLVLISGINEMVKACEVLARAGYLPDIDAKMGYMQRLNLWTVENSICDSTWGFHLTEDGVLSLAKLSMSGTGVEFQVLSPPEGDTSGLLENHDLSFVEDLVDSLGQFMKELIR